MNIDKMLIKYTFVVSKNKCKIWVCIKKIINFFKKSNRYFFTPFKNMVVLFFKIKLAYRIF